jgi:outer membrane protein OmpA-like peptidoglycan-associated protein
MRALYFVILFLFVFADSGIASDRPGRNDKRLIRAEELYSGGSYASALSAFLEVYSLDSLNFRLCYRIGECYLKTGSSSPRAEYYLRRSLGRIIASDEEEAIRQKAAPLEAYKLLGDACHLNYRFSEAIGFYTHYINSLENEKIHDLKLTKGAEACISSCRQAIELVSQPIDVTITNLGAAVNSPYPDYAPRLTADGHTLFFTSRRPENTGGKTYDEGQYFEDVYVSNYVEGVWKNAIGLGEPVNTFGNEAAMAVSADGQELLIYKDDMGDGNIYSSRLQGDKWTVPLKLNGTINSKYWEPCGFISADGSSLYFVSDRPGGFGGTDIYKSTRQVGGDWGQAVNLGPSINTPSDEYSPFLHPDGQTLYFSSRGHRGMGGYDVFFSRPLPSDQTIWLQPVNVGYPINSPGDDVFYMVTADKQRAYYSSLRVEGLGEKDNYEVRFSHPDASPLALVRGTFQDGQSHARIIISDNRSHQVLSIVEPNSKTGDFSYILTPGKSYNISYESDSTLFYSENRFILEGSPYSESLHPVELPLLSVGSKVVLNNLFFDFDKTEIRTNSQQELDRILTFLQKYPTVCLEFTGYADSRGNDAYNRRLAKSRAQSVVNFLVRKGISSERLSAKSYPGNSYAGEQAADGNSNDNAGRQMDRRVELKIIALKL